MSTKDYATSVLDTLNENQLMDFLRLFANDNILAKAESDYIAKNPNRKHYNDFSEILAEIDDENYDDE